MKKLIISVALILGFCNSALAAGNASKAADVNPEYYTSANEPRSLQDISPAAGKSIAKAKLPVNDEYYTASSLSLGEISPAAGAAHSKSVAKELPFNPEYQ